MGGPTVVNKEPMARKSMGVNPGVLAKFPLWPSYHPQLPIGSFIPSVTIPKVIAVNENVLSVKIPSRCGLFHTIIYTLHVSNEQVSGFSVSLMLTQHVRLSMQVLLANVKM
jgi:hypothetical protein